MATFNDGIAPLLFGHPFFATLLLKLRHKEDRTIPTACVSQRTLHYNPDFFATLTIEEATFVVGHEVGHVAWMHLPRLKHYMESKVGPDGQPFDWDLFQKAMDYPNNAMLVDGKVGTPISADKFQLCLDQRRFPATMTPEEVYVELKKDQQSGKRGGSSAGGAGRALDKHDADGDGDEGGDATDGTREITAADILQAAEIHKRVRGEYPAGLDRLLDQLKRPTNSPWAILRREITKALPGRDSQSWRRPNRRMIVRGIGMPGPVQIGSGSVGVVVDTSGSIDKEMLQFFGGHLCAILEDARPQVMHVYWTDAKMHRRDTVKSPSELAAMLQEPVPGGGGTDMREGVAAAMEDKCDAIVVLTDGYTPFCDPGKNVVWAITTQVEAPSGTTIHIS